VAFLVLLCGVMYRAGGTVREESKGLPALLKKERQPVLNM